MGPLPYTCRRFPPPAPPPHVIFRPACEKALLLRSREVFSNVRDGPRSRGRLEGVWPGLARSSLKTRSHPPTKLIFYLEFTPRVEGFLGPVAPEWLISQRSRFRDQRGTGTAEASGTRPPKRSGIPRGPQSTSPKTAGIGSSVGALAVAESMDCGSATPCAVAEPRFASSVSVQIGVPKSPSSVAEDASFEHVYRLAVSIGTDRRRPCLK